MDFDLDFPQEFSLLGCFVFEVEVGKSALTFQFIDLLKILIQQEEIVIGA
jgi:hypothetical protein